MKPAMQKLTLTLENCYGIRRLKETLDFGDKQSYAIYAPNGSMKSSLHDTFKDLVEGRESRDRIFPERQTTRIIEHENGALGPEDLVVIGPYDPSFETERTSTLLVDADHRRKYEKILADVETKQTSLLTALAKQAKSKSEIATKLVEAFEADDVPQSLTKLHASLNDDAQPFADLDYDLIFTPTTIAFLQTKDFRTLIRDYIKKNNELIAKSTYFRREAFNYYGANKINDSLDDHGFFAANHKLVLTAKTPLEVTSNKQLADLIAEEKKKISDDPDQRKRYAEIAKALEKNQNMREFQDYLDQHQDILAELSDIEEFKRKVWKSYANVHRKLLEQYIETKKATDQEKLAIEEEAANQATRWEEVLRVFNRRFSVPFELKPRNKTSAVLGKAPLEIKFVFKDAAGKKEVERGLLQETLSQGEKKALYILNVIFEVEARKKANQRTLFVFDDIADSFDYKNKYAIIQYLQDIARHPGFNLLILTHNFDFFRTINSRFIPRNCCKMAIRSEDDVRLYKAEGIRNIFIHDWKKAFDEDPKKRVACVAFMRNMMEYLRGEEDSTFLKLTSLLHWRPDSIDITHKDLDAIYNELFATDAKWHNQKGAVMDTILEEAENCLTADDAVNLENKIVLSVAIRITAERYMVSKINDPAFFESINKGQTRRLYDRFTETKRSAATLEVLDRVLLMTPENIHLNSFMYEPIMDMGDHHLRQLYKDVKALH